MLRTLVLILLIVNLAFFSWTQGWLNAIVGISPSAQQEPERLKEQLNADQLAVIPPAEAASVALMQAISRVANPEEAAAASSPFSNSAASAAATALPAPIEEPVEAPATPTVSNICLRAGPFGTMEMSIVANNLQPTLTPEQWRTEDITIEGMWFVYMGPYADREVFRRKQSELREIGVTNFQEVRTPTSLANGLVLGRYDQPQAAQAALEKLKDRGVRSARVVIVRPRMQAQNVIVPQATPELQTALDLIKLPQGKRFSTCP